MSLLKYIRNFNFYVIFEFYIRSRSQARFIFSLVFHSIGREFFVRFSEIDGNLYRNSEKAVTQPPQGHTKIVKNKMVLIRPYLVTHSKPLPNIFWVGAGRQVFSVPSLAESARVACRYGSIRTILLFTIFVKAMLHCVPRTTVSFQKHATPSKIDRFSKIFHWVITNALTFVSKS